MISENAYRSVRENLRGSFALWGPPKSGDRKNVDDLSIFADYNTVKEKLKPNIIFVAMNLAGDATKGMRPYSNFHSSVTKHNDYRLRDAIQGTPFEGAYMTDLFKPITSISGDIDKYYRAHPEEKRAEVEAFVAECRALYDGPKYVICIGQGCHYQTIKELLIPYQDFVCRYKRPADPKKPCFYIPHYSGAAGNTDESYHQKAMDQLLKIEKEIFG